MGTQGQTRQEKPRIWVTGSTGFIGSRLLKTQLSDRFSVLAHTRSRENLSALMAQKGVDACSFGDLEEGPIVWPDSSGISGVIHLASPSSWSELNLPEVYERILKSTRMVFENALARGCEHFIYVSSASALGGYLTRRDWRNSKNHQMPSREAFPYAAAKLEAEKWLRGKCHETGVMLSVIYPSEVYGSDDDRWVTAPTIREMITGSIRLVSDGGTYIVHVEDAALALCKCALSGVSQRQFLASEFLEFQELAKVCRKLSGKRALVFIVADWLVNVAIALRAATGLDFVGHPDAAARYGQVHWSPENLDDFDPPLVSARTADAILSDVTQWILRNNSH